MFSCVIMEVFVVEHHPLFDKLMSQLKKKYDTRDMSIESAIVLTGLAMQLVQNIRYKSAKLSGDDKRKLVTDLVVSVIEEIEMAEETKETITKVFVPAILPSLIDGMCRLDVNRFGAKGGCWGC